MKLQRCMDEYSKVVDEQLQKYFSSVEMPRILREAMSYSVFSGGKRLRPCMALFACDMVGGDREAALPLACGVEMIHTYSLIHDDLPMLDNDALRRGRPTNHKVFGDANAILAGDGLLTFAFEIMLDAMLGVGANVPGYGKAMKALANGAGVNGMVAGQITDLANEKNPLSGKEELVYTHEKKTGALLLASLLAGAYMAELTDAQDAAIQTYGKAYGMLFQITDDILDVVGTSEKLGKTVGKDARAGKLTYPSLFGIDGAQLRARRAAMEAKEALAPFGDKAELLIELCDYTLGREK